MRLKLYLAGNIELGMNKEELVYNATLVAAGINAVELRKLMAQMSPQGEIIVELNEVVE